MKKYLTTWLLMLILPYTVLGQESSGSTLSVDQLIEEALQNNPELRAADHLWLAAQSRQQQVSSLPDPVFSYTLFGQSIETRLGPQEGVFSLAQTVPFPGKLGFREKMAERDAFRVQQHYESRKRDIIFAIKQSYYELAALEESLKILNNYLQLLRDFKHVAEQKYATGQGIQANVLKAQVEISGILERGLLFEKMIFSATARLNRLRGTKADAQLQATGGIQITRPVLNDSLVLQTAISERQELKSLHAKIESNEFSRKLAGRNFWPDLKVQANYITIGKGALSSPEAGRDAWSLMFGVNLPLWFGGRKAAILESNELIAASQRALEDQRIAIGTEVSDILSQVSIIQSSLNLYEQGLLIQATSSLESATASYGTGSLDFLSLLDAQRMLLNIELAYIKEKGSYMKQLSALERAAGGILPQ